uniref:Capsid n=1 Tax=Genomoviridae sp. TaxID=2202565 RepID=A0A894JMI2_9VIRU|nr:capsid [Genomoviridae sp.]
MSIEAKDDDPTQPTEVGEPLTLLGQTPFASLFMPTARASEPLELEYYRNRSLTYGVGYSEKLDLHTNNGGQWVWRRIAFSMKGPQIHADFPAETLHSNDLNAGYTRPFWNILGSSADAAPARQATEDLLFSGEGGKDWHNRLYARVDTSRVSLHMDRTRHIRGGNADAHRHTFKDWIPIGKNILYDEEEAGEEKTFNVYSVNSKIGFGDLYIYDYFECNTLDDSYRMNLECQGVYYWRER